MRKKILAKTRPSINNLLDYIEEYAGFEIEFISNPYPVNQNDPNPNALAGLITESSAILFVRNIDDVTEEGLLNMLLQIKRYWVENIPQIIPAENDDAKFQITSSIERNLERLITVPQEKFYGIDSSEYWNTTMSKLFDKYPELTNDPWVRKKTYLLDWITVSNIVTNVDVKEKFKQYLHHEGILPSAQLFNKEIIESLHSKEKCLLLTTKYLNIPLADIRLRNLDVKKKEKIDKIIEDTKKKKPSGSVGWVRFDFDGKNNAASFLKTYFSPNKDTVEFLIANAFISNAIKNRIIDFEIKIIEQNNENHLDFKLTTKQGIKFLELMEIAPLEKVHSYEKAQEEHNAYEFATYLKAKILHKSNKYIGIKQTEIMLLIYNTDWRFNPSNEVFRLLQYWLSTTKHSFKYIYCYEPLSDTEGYITEIYPTSTMLDEKFNPENLRNATFINLNPTKWQK